MRFTLTAAAAMANVVFAQTNAEQAPVDTPMLGTFTSQGCFSAKAGEKADIRASFISSGTCADACEDSDFTVAITGGQSCYCANEYPPKDALVDDKNCDYSCPGYPLEACGGLASDGNDGYFSVWNLGVKVNVPNAKGGDGDAEDGEEDKPKDDSKADNGQKEDGKEDNGEKDGDDDEHHSPTALWTASHTPSGTATVTTSVSVTPTNDDSDGSEDAESTSATASPTPVESGPPEDAAAGLAINMAGVAGALVVVAAAF